MGKPYGLTPFFQVIEPHPLHHRIWDVVRECQESGMLPEVFIRECAEAWEHEAKVSLDAELSVFRQRS